MFAVFSFVGAKMQSLARVFASRVANDGGTTESLNCINPSYLLSQASFLQIPSGVKATVAYSELPTNGNGDLTWSRNSVANRTQSNGDIGSVAANVPRLDYSQGSCPALLLEPQRTNLALYSEEFDNASWGKSNATITANSTNAPNSTLTADSLIEDTSTGLHFITQGITVVTNTTYTGTIYVKSNTRTKGRFRINDTGGQPATDGNFDLTAQTISNGTITNVGNGWYRLSLSRLMGSTSGAFVVFLADNSGNISYTGNGTSGLFLWGGQLELGAYPTTYIQTTNATATRLVDTFTRNNIFTNGLISASGGTWYIELRNNIVYTRDAAGTLSLDTSLGGLVNGFAIRNNATTNRLNIAKVISNVITYLYSTTTDTTKIAIKWDGTTADVFVNGVKQVSATAFTTTAMEFLIGNGGDVPKFIQAMALYPTPLSDADCQILTT